MKIPDRPVTVRWWERPWYLIVSVGLLLLAPLALLFVALARIVGRRHRRKDYE